MDTEHRDTGRDEGKEVTPNMGNEKPTPKIPASELQAQLRRLLRVRFELRIGSQVVPQELEDKIQDVRKALGIDDKPTQGKK